jgi:hypothetical protein
MSKFGRLDFAVYDVFAVLHREGYGVLRVGGTRRTESAYLDAKKRGGQVRLDLSTMRLMSFQSKRNLTALIETRASCQFPLNNSRIPSSGVHAASLPDLPARAEPAMATITRTFARPGESCFEPHGLREFDAAANPCLAYNKIRACLPAVVPMNPRHPCRSGAGTAADTENLSKGAP